MKISRKFKIQAGKISDKWFLLAVLIFISLFVSCKTKMNVTVKDEKNNADMLSGLCNRQAFENVSYKTWFDEEYFGYNPIEPVIDELSEIVQSKKIDILVVFGTWCSDSRREIPRFYKIIDNIGINESDIKLVAVDRTKTAKGDLLGSIVIEKVPTFFFYENGKEIGRIIEVPTLMLEEDILKILK
jgi:thiol-disulfide isomerase/thioredoxin